MLMLNFVWQIHFWNLLSGLTSMLKKIPVFTAIFFILLPQMFLGRHISSVADNPRIFNERFVVRALIEIHGAQATYQAVNGNGNFGSLANLYSAGLIDSALATGSKYGYTFAMSVTSYSAVTPSRFNVTATPQRYPRTGRRSFYQDETAEVRGGDLNGSVATAADPFIDSCAQWGLSDNERCAIQALRTLHGAEMTYSSTYGNGNFTGLSQLGKAQFVNRTLATGIIHGYQFTVTFVTRTSSVPASFRISAVPQTYGSTGIRSFHIATDGVVRGADKQGAAADENDPEVDLCLGLGMACYESVSIGSLRTLHGAEMTWAATNGNGAFGTITQLADASLISQSLGDGIHFGYSYTVITTVRTINTPATFAVSAVPVTYGVTGFRSFFIATEGVIRGADKNGLPADENDPPVNQ